MRKTVSTTLVGAVLAMAGLVAGCMGGDGGESATTSGAPPATSTAEQPATALPPSDFTAEPTAFRVTLTWEPPPEDVDRYELYRDGTTLAIQPGSATSYTDDDVLPGQQYTYEIEAQVGEVSAGRIPASAETPVPPLRAARLDGTFNVTTRFVSKSGYGDYSRPNFGWRFVPRCAEGPCNVVWRDINETGFRARLARRGARYGGTYRGRFTMECSGSPSTSRVELELRVVAAKVVGDIWLATRLEGTMEQSEVARLGCRAAEATLSVRARLVR